MSLDENEQELIIKSGWDESSELIEALIENDDLLKVITEELENLETEWASDDWDDDDEILSHSIDLEVPISSLEIEEVVEEDDSLFVRLQGLVDFSVSFDLNVANGERRIIDPEDKSKVLLPPPIASTSLDGGPQAREFTVELKLGKNKYLHVEALTLLDTSPLLVSRPDPWSLDYEEDEEDFEIED